LLNILFKNGMWNFPHAIPDCRQSNAWNSDSTRYFSLFVARQGIFYQASRNLML